MATTNQALTGYPSIDKPWLKYYTEEAINAPLPECTIYEYVYTKNKDNLTNNAIDYFGHKYTYAQMFDEIEKTTRAYSQAGICENDVVSICSFTTPETIFSFYALNRLGAVCNIIEPRTSSALIRDRINQTKSKILLVIDSFFHKIEPILDEINVEKIVVVNLSDAMPIAKKAVYFVKKFSHNSKVNYKATLWRQFVAISNNTEEKIAPYRPGRPAAIIYTSGTTGIAKGAVFSDDCLTRLELQCQTGNPRIYHGETFLNIMPPFIAYGMFFGLFFVFCAGHENILIPVTPPDRFYKFFLKHIPNHAVGVSTHWEMLAQKCGEDADLSKLMCAITGGDRLSSQTEMGINEFFQKHGCSYHVQKGYGMTEMCSVVTFTQCEEVNEVGSVGIPLCKNIVMAVEPGTENELPYYQQGEICITGPSMMLGYYNNLTETNRTIWTHSDGKQWIHTGDFGYITDNGVLYIVDRIKRMIVRPDGHNVWPSVIENVLIRHPAVKECAVVGLPNPCGNNGKIPAAFVVLTPEWSEKTFQIECELREMSLREINERDAALLYYFIDEIPLTSVGKVDINKLETGNWPIGEYKL